MEKDVCPQCGSSISSPNNRLVQDSCGHKKCRVCLLNDETKCKLCDSTVISSVKESVIKCSSELKTSVVSVLNEIKVEKVTDDINLKQEPNNQESVEIVKRPYVSLVVPQHISVLKENPPGFFCTLCNKAFTTKSHVRYHIYCSGEKKPLQCNACGKSFINRYHLDTHSLTHSGLKPHVCNTCGKGFAQKGKLNRHKKLHTGIKSFVCKECGKAFFDKDALSGHARIHSKDKTYSCHVCSKQYSNSSNLKKHSVIHDTEKSHMCDECGKIFKLKWTLTIHRRTHTREKPHKCLTCSKAFTNSKDLKRHKLIHIDVKPYSCGVCGTGFRRKDNLERHMKNTHPGKTVAPLVNKSIQQPQPTVVVEKPNAINVIIAPSHRDKTPIQSKPIPVTNGPFKLAFKTRSFKDNYNIQRDYTEPPKIHPKKPYDLAESVNICQRILSPHSPPRITRSTYKDAEQMSAEICQRIMTPTITQTPLHYETSFEHKKHAIIKNIKFKLPSNYTNIKNGEKTINLSDDSNETNNDSHDPSSYVDLKPINHTASATSVIVNNPPSTEMHWRRRTLQNLHPK